MATEMPRERLSQEVKKRSGWAIFTGFLIAAIGVFLIAYPLLTAAVTTVLLGWGLIVAAIAHFVFALHSHSIGSFLLKAIVSVLLGFCGISLAFSPLSGVAVLTALLGAVLVIEAGVLIALAFQARPAEGWGWFLVDGGVTLLLGLLIVARWPASSVWAIGTLIGVSVLMNGITRIMVATKIRRGAATIEEFRRAA